MGLTDRWSASCCWRSARSRRRCNAGVTPMSITPFRSRCEPLARGNLSSSAADDSDDDDVLQSADRSSFFVAPDERFDFGDLPPLSVAAVAEGADSSTPAKEPSRSSSLTFPSPVIVCNSWYEFSPEFVLSNHVVTLNSMNNSSSSINLSQ